MSGPEDAEVIPLIPHLLREHETGWQVDEQGTATEDAIERAIDRIVEVRGCSRFEAAERLVGAIMGEPIEEADP